MRITELICILFWSLIPLPSDGAPRFNATPYDNSSTGYIIYAPDSASFFTLSWDYDADGETVKYVQLTALHQGLVARKFPNGTLQTNETGPFSGRVTFSGRATFTISNITRNDSTVYFCGVYFNTGINPQIFNYIDLTVVVKPTITLRPSSPIVINEGSTTTLRCDAIRSFYQTLAWIKNSTILSRTIVATDNVSYTITSATKYHAGVYTCKVIAAPGLPAQYSTSYNVTVKVRFKPQVKLSGNTSVNEGSDAYLLCKADAYPTPVTYRWFVGVKQIKSDPNGTFVINDLEDGWSRLMVRRVSTNNGTFQRYGCSGTNVMGTGEIRYALLAVLYAPRLIFTYPRPRVVSLNQRVSLHCFADGLPSVSYYWKLNGHALNNGNQGSDSLVITKAKKEDVGSYSCVANNTLGFKESEPFVLNVEYGVPHFNATPHSNITGGIIHVNDTTGFFTLSWDYDSRGAAVKYVEIGTWPASTWVARKFPNETVQINEASRYSGRVNFSGRATFTILNLTRDDSRIYYCQVFLSSRYVSSITDYVNLIGADKPIVTLRSPSPVVVDEGKATTLLCAAILSRFQTLTWTKRSTILRRSYGASYNLSYTITSATKDHAGVYTCKVFPGPGLPAQYSTSYNVTVKVRFKPQVRFSGNVTANEGSDALLFCKADAYPTSVKYHWFVEGKQIKSDPNGKFVINDLEDGWSRLTVKRVSTNGRYNAKNGTGRTYRHGQLYGCSGTNVMGTGEIRYAHLVVNYAPRHAYITTYPNPAVVALNQRLSLYCSADSLPLASYFYWKLNGHVLNRGNQRSSSLMINAEVKDAGNYSCVAKNELGSKESTSVIVNVEHKPSVTTFTTGTSDNTVVQGTTVTLTCSTDGYPPPTYIIGRGVRTLEQQSTTGKHVISNVQLSVEEESFFCDPSNVEGNGPRKELKITVQVPPTFPSQTLPRTKEIIREGQPISFSCTAEAKPAAEFVWALNGKILANLPPYSISAAVTPIPRSKLSRTIGYLIIDKFSSKQNGNLSCIAINDAGLASHSSELEVAGSPSESSKESANADRQENKQKELSAGEISGIVISIIFLLLIIAALGAYILWSKRQGLKRNGIGEEHRKNRNDRCSFVNEALEMAQGVDFQPDQDDKRHGDEVN